MKSERTKVLLADDHTIVREGILSLLQAHQGIAVVGTAENGQEAIEKARRTFPDIVVMDIAMPLLNGIEATRQLRRLLPQTKVIVLTMYADEEYVLRAASRRSGLPARNARPPPSCCRRSTRSSAATSTRARRISHVVIERFLSSPGPVEGDGAHRARASDPAARRRGTRNRQIAIALGITPKTVDTHRTRLMTKLDIHDTPGLVRYAIRKGIVTADS
jgi:DNA-binding NarL/FixJ family response regulator